MFLSELSAKFEAGATSSLRGDTLPQNRCFLFIEFAERGTRSSSIFEIEDAMKAQ